MTTASLENSRRLFELSGWVDTTYFDKGGKLQFVFSVGYLLRKLPANLEYIHREKDFIDGSDLPEVKIRGNVYVGLTAQNKATAGYGSMQGHFYLQYADTPEDALCLLAIKLFEQNILTKEGYGE